MKKPTAMTLALVSALSLSACQETAQPVSSSFIPEQPLRWVCTSSPGGGSDLFTHTLMDILEEEALLGGQPITLSTETDGGGEVAHARVAAAPAGEADYLLLTFNSGDLLPMVANTDRRVEDFRILALMAEDRQLLCSCPGAALRTEYALAGGLQNDLPAAVDAARSGIPILVGGSKGDDAATYHALLEQLGLRQDQMCYVAYDSTSDAITAALAGNLDFVLTKPAAAAERLRSHQLVGVAALSKERYQGDLSDIPTLSELGDYEDVELPVWRAVAAPAAMSDEAAAYWSQALGQAADSVLWTEGYLEKYHLRDAYLPEEEATDYVLNYEAQFLASLGRSEELE